MAVFKTGKSNASIHRNARPRPNHELALENLKTPAEFNTTLRRSSDRMLPCIDQNFEIAFDLAHLQDYQRKPNASSKH